jgi:ketosteroid isomerase-like protein
MTADHDALTALEHEWMEAVQRNDLEALDRILALEFAYTASGHGRWSRQQWMETVPDYDIQHFRYDDIDVHRYGEVAVVLSRCDLEAVVAGIPRAGEFLLTDVWVQRDGRWQVTTRSSIMMPERRSIPRLRSPI